MHCRRTITRDKWWVRACKHKDVWMRLLSFSCVGGQLHVNSSSAANSARFACVCALIVITLSGCAIKQITSPFRSRGEGGRWSTTVSEDLLLEAAKNDTTNQFSLPSRDKGCPRVTAWQRDRTLTVYEQGKVGNQLAIRHRGEITKTARECDVGRKKVTVKYGFAGRVLLGPRGQPGTITLPLRVHVTDSARNIISSENVSVSVSVSPGMLVGFFSAVREVSFATPDGGDISQYQLYVAFDRKAADAS